MIGELVGMTIAFAAGGGVGLAAALGQARRYRQRWRDANWALQRAGTYDVQVALDLLEARGHDFVGLEDSTGEIVAYVLTPRAMTEAKNAGLAIRAEGDRGIKAPSHAIVESPALYFDRNGNPMRRLEDL